MTPHPDALIELHRQGQLSDAARTELAAHLDQCSACAAEVWARAIMVRECDPLHGDAELNRLAVKATLAKLGARPVLMPRKRRAWPWALAAALPLCALAAFGPWLGGEKGGNPSPRVVLPAASGGSPLPLAMSPTAMAPSAGPSASPEPFPAASASSAPAVPAPRRSGRAELLGPSELLRHAGDLGREGKRAQALDVYRELQQRFAPSAEAKLSRVLVGSLLLAQGRYRPAIAQFDSYLASGGPATEEALAGRATAFQALGDRTGEAASWRALLERFPRSVHASHARQRMTAISASANAGKPLSYTPREQ